MDLASLGEFGLIARLNEKLAQRGGVRLGIGDDAAVLESLGAPVVTCDALIEGIHFRLDWTTARDLGWKSIAVNVSDIAAMGGLPVAAFVALALPPGCAVEWVEELYSGMEESAEEYNLTIAGGDTTKSLSGVMLSVTIIGNAPNLALRSGAKSGDILLVTGTLGDSAAGLELLLRRTIKMNKQDRTFALTRHVKPNARLSEMQAALTVENAVHAAMDLSDGLAGDAAHIARASNVTLEIETEQLPISDSCRAIAQVARRDVLDFALRGGEDYELLLCVAPDKADEVIAAIQNATGTTATIVGRCIARETAPVLLVQNGVRQAAPAAFTHF